jgi:hypothetical protein
MRQEYKDALHTRGWCQLPMGEWYHAITNSLLYTPDIKALTDAAFAAGHAEGFKEGFERGAYEELTQEDRDPSTLQQKQNGAWVPCDALKPVIIKGRRGKTGATGAPGAPGATGATGRPGPRGQHAYESKNQYISWLRLHGFDVEMYAL